MLRVYKASAGSGKTFTLAREYITLVLGTKGDDGRYHLNRSRREMHRSILAITFTNKATEEMKSRIIHELAVIAGLEPGWTKESPYSGYLMNLYGCSREELREAAAKALKDLLFDFNFFHISTIDAFFQVILRTFAREAELTGSYDVELDDRYVIASSVDRLFEDLNHTDDPETRRIMAWLKAYMKSLIDEGHSFNIFNRESQLHSDLISFIGDVSNETFMLNYDVMMSYLSDSDRLVEFARELNRIASTNKARTLKACEDAMTAILHAGFVDKKLVNANLVKLLQKWIAAGGYHKDGYGKTGENVLLDIENAYTAAGKKSSLRVPAVDALVAEAVESMRVTGGENQFFNCVRKNLYTLGLLSRVYSTIDDYRKEHETILLSDTNSILKRIIGDADTPFVYERVGVWFNHFLIDEFQDTSRMQWDNLRPLLNESLATDNDNLVIGDLKQCIYRFRGSDPSLIRNVHNDVVGHAEVRGEMLADNTNWRSSAEVVRFNNTLFTLMASEMGFSKQYAGVAQLVSPKHTEHHGYVKLSRIPGKKVKADKDEVEEYDPRRAALEIMGDEIARELQAGYMPADIAILVRGRKDGIEVIDYLLERGASDPLFREMRIVSDNALLVSRCRSVRLIVSVLRYISSSDFVSSPSRKSRREIARLLNRYEYLLSRGSTPSEALVGAIHSPESVEELVMEVADMDCVNLTSIVERIISRYISPADLARDNIFITAFQDLVADFSDHGAADVSAFLKWWDGAGSKVAVAGAPDGKAITILTIHKAKGLEYKCVHIPFAGLSLESGDIKWFDTAGAFSGMDPAIVPPLVPLSCTSALSSTPVREQYERYVRENLLDEFNVLYVAFTRAVDELVVTLTDDVGESSINRFLFSAVDRATPDTCDSLEHDAGIDSGRDGHVSPFVPLRMGEEDVLTLGSPCRPSHEEKEMPTAMEPVETMAMTDYYANDRADLWADTRIDSIRDITVARERGIILHDLMSRIRTPRDISRAMRQSTRAGMIPDSEADEILDLITRRVNDPEVSSWFNGFTRLLMERPVITGSDDSQRPDRVVWTAEGTIDVIDYKFGIERPARYARQVSRYMSLLRDMYPSTPVRGYIWYLDSGEIVPVK